MFGDEPVEGPFIEVESANGLVQRFSYAETFVIPAAAENVKVKNLVGSEAIMVVADQVRANHAPLTASDLCLGLLDDHLSLCQG